MTADKALSLHSSPTENFHARVNEIIDQDMDKLNHCTFNTKPNCNSFDGKFSPKRLIFQKLNAAEQNSVISILVELSLESST